MSETRAECILKEIRSSLLECRVCFESFSVEKADRRPHNLPCGHVLCLKCVHALSVIQKLECPFCRKLWDVNSTSECRALVHLQDLLQPDFKLSGWTESAGCGTLQLRSAFGGWGEIINPSGMALSESSGNIFIVHDGEKRVSVFDPQGARLDSFGCYGHQASDICHPLDVALTKCGRVLVTDAGDQSLKVFTSKGVPLVIVRDFFRLPWGVDVDRRGRVFVTDAEMGTLTKVLIDFSSGVVVNRVVLKDLTSPRSIASSRTSGNIAVVECFKSSFTLRLFNSDFVPLKQVDSFGLNLRSSVSLSMSSVAFDRNGDVIVGDALNGMVWSLGKLQKELVLTPLVGGLTHPVALAATLMNLLVILDAGDHTVKIYAMDADDLYCDETDK